jgi:hypothetical protein
MQEAAANKAMHLLGYMMRDQEPGREDNQSMECFVKGQLIIAKSRRSVATQTDFIMAV